MRAVLTQICCCSNCSSTFEGLQLFCISFKTVPEDDTGVFHILEHSVLGGSEKYPVKEPFLYLLKGSMNTFLNAMTYPDKTVYPVASCNDTDFKNLMHVYFCQEELELYMKYCHALRPKELENMKVKL